MKKKKNCYNKREHNTKNLLGEAKKLHSSLSQVKKVKKKRPKFDEAYKTLFPKKNWKKKERDGRNQLIVYWSLRKQNFGEAIQAITQSISILDLYNILAQ